MSIQQLLILQHEMIEHLSGAPYHEEFVNYDLIEHPEYLEDETHHYDTIRRHLDDHESHDTFAHTYEAQDIAHYGHHAPTAHHDLDQFYRPSYHSGHGYVTEHGFTADHGHFDDLHHHDTHHFDEHLWIDPKAETPEQQHQSEYHWLSDHHYIPATDHEYHQAVDPDQWSVDRLRLVDIVTPAQHYYSDPIHQEEMHLQHPIHYETDRYIDPYTHHETILTQPVPRDSQYSIETPVHDLYETLHPADHYDTEYWHERGHETPVHHYDYDIPHHEMIDPDHHGDHGFEAQDYHSHVFGAQY